jgi:hypothetical protein
MDTVHIERPVRRTDIARLAVCDPEATFDNPVGSSRTNSFVFYAIKTIRVVRMDDDEGGIPGARGADATKL